MAKGLVKFNIQRCKGCELCVSVCPKGILKLHEVEFNSQGFHPAYVFDPENCIGCGNCAVMCPDGAISVYQED